MVLNRLFAFILCLGLFTGIYAQKGKNGAASYTTAASTIVNAFTDIKADALAGATTLSVTSSSLNSNFTTTLTPGDLVMVIQMQGAMMNLGTYAISWLPDSTYGKVWDYANCGNYEFAEVKSVISTTQIELNCGLQKSYSLSGKSQVVRVPRYSSLNVGSSATLTTVAWNGTTGGVLAIEVDGNTTVNGLVSANATGFRGGIALGNSSSGNSSFTTKSANDGAEKGEGIGSNRLNNLVDSLGTHCKGAPANGGGGGNSNNCGGGGGGNGGNLPNYKGLGICNTTFSSNFNLEYAGRASITSSGGGKGGYGTSSTTTVSANTVGPNNSAWGSFKRPSYGGFGGRPLDYSTGKIFMGGGGGAGHMSSSQSNGANACSGGAGGGIIYFLNYGTISGSGTISSNGANGNNAFGNANFTNPVQGIDGAGGAGAGGTIFLESTGSISGITANANGGKGGNQIISGASSNEGQGPGGGGGGGYIAGNGSAFTQNVLAGSNGTTNATAFDVEFPMNGATSGDVGTANQTILAANSNTYILTTSSNQTICANQSVNLTATSSNTNASISWYNAAAGGNAVSSGTLYTTPTYTTAGTYTVYAGSCPGLYRSPIIITVTSGFSISINSPTICPNQSVVLTPTTTATTFTWSTGVNTSSISVSPTVTTVYTLNATGASCVGTKTTQVTVASVPSLTVANASICSTNSTTLTASGATNYTWAPGGQTTSNIVVTPSVTTNYTITGTNGTCTNSTTANVNVTTTPTLSTVNPQTICNGQTATFTVSGATSYTWNPGNITGSTFTLNPSSSTSISVLGANGTCTAQTTSSLTVTQNPTISVLSQIICPSQTVALTASGANTYTWNTGANTNTLSVSPGSTTVYTVNGTTNSCSSSKTVTVTVASQPTFAISGNADICSGSTSTLSVSGSATNYTWMPGGQIASSIAVSPTTTTIYTVTGSNGTCSNTTTATLSVTTTPTLTAPSATICSGQTATLTASNATTYTWTPGNVTGNTYIIAPPSNTVVTVIGANGTCTAQATVSVTIGSAVSISVPPSTICVGQSATLTATPVDSYTWSTGSNTNTTVVSPTVTTTYTVSGTQGSCTGSGTVEVTVIAQPTLSVSDATVCSGNSTTLTVIGSATSYTWLPGAQTTTSIVVTPTTNTTYSITGSNGVCSNSTTATVSITPIPTLIASSANICPGAVATLTVGGANTFTWTPGNITGNTFTMSPSSSVTVNVTGENNGCTSQTTAVINVNSNPPISVTDQNICIGQTATLTAGGATTYTWNTGSNLSSITVTPTISTTYTVSGTVGSCIGTNTVMVNVTSLPNISVTGNSPICSGSTATLTANGATNYTWVPNGQTSSSIIDNPNTTSTYTLIGFDGACTNTTTATLSVTSTPTLSAQSITVCAGQPASITASGATTYTWNPGNVTGTTYTLNPVSTETVSMIGANGTCTAQTTHTVYVGTALSVSINSLTICEGETATLLATTSATLYSWNTGANTNSIVVSPTTTTVYSINVSNGSCTGNGTTTVVVNSLPVITATANAICGGQTSTLSATGANTYTWIPGSLSGATQTVNPTSTTVYTISGTSIDGCLNTGVYTTTVNVTSLPNVSITSSPTICAGQTATLTASGATNYTWMPGGQTTSSINVTPTNNTTYTVTGDNGGCSGTYTTMITVSASPTVIISSNLISGCPGVCVDFTDVALSSNSINYNFGDGNSDNTNNPTHCYDNAGTYTVVATAQNTIGSCSANSNQIIVTVNGPTANFNIEEGAIITAGTTVHFTNLSSNATTYAWDLDLGNPVPLVSTNANEVYTDIGTYCITLLATDGVCADTVTKCIEVVKETSINIPNVFTPNGDNSNEFFKITGTSIKNFHCTIYDRWGIKLYEWDGINGAWDGNSKSGAAPAGTYYYIIDYTDVKDKSTTEKGFLSLFRE